MDDLFPTVEIFPVWDKSCPPLLNHPPLLPVVSSSFPLDFKIPFTIRLELHLWLVSWFSCTRLRTFSPFFLLTPPGFFYYLSIPGIFFYFYLHLISDSGGLFPFPCALSLSLPNPGFLKSPYPINPKHQYKTRAPLK